MSNKIFFKSLYILRALDKMVAAVKASGVSAASGKVDPGKAGRVYGHMSSPWDVLLMCNMQSSHLHSPDWLPASRRKPCSLTGAPDV